MVKRAFLALAALAVASWVPWPPHGAEAARTPKVEAPSAVSFKHDVAPLLVTSCSMASCHGAGLHPPEIDSDVDTATLRRALLASASEERPDRGYVAPGDPSHSYLVDKIEGRLVDAQCEDHDCGDRMPARNPALSDHARATIAAWIAQGAKDN